MLKTGLISMPYRTIHTRNRLLRQTFILLISIFSTEYAMAEQDIYTIDDRSTGDTSASSGNTWRLFTDDVMGGVSNGTLSLETRADAAGQQLACLHMQGDVRLDNNGGFVQIALNLSDEVVRQAPAYRGISFDILGNGEDYNLHLRTDGLWFPWQSYRATFNATADWQTVRIPFSEFKAYKTFSKLDTSELSRIGFVAIGREFTADLCITNIRLYR
jgi:hypothetical protein